MLFLDPDLDGILSAVSLQVWLLALWEAHCEEDNLGCPQERVKSWEELKNLCCVQHSATWLSVWVTYRGNWNWWWRALVSIKLKCVTRSDYAVWMLWVYPRLTAQAFSRGGNKEMQQLISLWLSISANSSVRNWIWPNSRCAAIWVPPVACGMRAQIGRSVGPSASVLSKKLDVQC